MINASSARAEVRDALREGAGGTLFLDRINMMSAQVQAHLMSWLDEDLTDPVAPDRPRRARLITATSSPLFPRVSAGTFHEALFYRLNVIHLDFTTW